MTRVDTQDPSKPAKSSLMDPTVTHPVRSLVMLATGAIIGLAIAGFGLFTAKGTTTGGMPPEDLALVNGRPVLMSDFIAQVEAENGVPFNQTTRAQKLKVVNDMIREELFVQRGLELDFPATDPDTRSALVAAVEQQVAAHITAEQPAEATLRAWYDSHPADYASDGTMILDELVAPGPADAAALARAAEAVKALRSGQTIEAVKARFGLKDSGRVNDGEEFYFAAEIHLGPKLFALAKTLKDGQVSEPQAEADGVHILVMKTHAPPVAQSFEASRQKVYYDYKKAQETKLQKADLDYLRAKSDIQIAKDYR